MEEISDTLKKLESISSVGPSKWMEKAEYRRANKKWLKRSQIVAVRILGELRRQGMTQKDLAHKMGITAQQVNKWLKGTENFTFEAISRLEEALDVTLMSVDLEETRAVMS